MAVRKNHTHPRATSPSLWKGQYWNRPTGASIARRYTKPNPAPLWSEKKFNPTALSTQRITKLKNPMYPSRVIHWAVTEPVGKGQVGHSMKNQTATTNQTKEKPAA